MRLTIGDSKSKLYLLCVLVFLMLHLGVWYNARNKQAQWLNVPPVPSVYGLAQMGLGDAQFALRVAGLNLQNMGDTGGRVTRLQDYNYERLEQWFTLSYEIDPKTNFFPMVAAYYYGASPDSEQVRHMVNYLEKAGNATPNEKWRWLAQAVFLARFKVKDNDLSLRLAYKLAELGKKDSRLPTWTQQMPAFVLAKQGDKQAARNIMETILLSDLQNLDPNEINYMCAYIKEQLWNGTETLYKNQEVTKLCEGRI